MQISRALSVRGRRERGLAAAGSSRPARAEVERAAYIASTRGWQGIFGENTAFALSNPGTFTMRVLRAFKANQGLLLAGAVAYYTLLSIVPVLILMLIALSRIIDQQELLTTLGRYLEWLIPGESAAVIVELAAFVEHRGVIGGCCWSRCCSSARSRSPCWRTRCR
jgi:hypothetical protein